MLVFTVTPTCDSANLSAQLPPRVSAGVSAQTVTNQMDVLQLKPRLSRQSLQKEAELLGDQSRVSNGLVVPEVSPRTPAHHNDVAVFLW